MYVDFKPNKIIDLSENEYFYEFIAVISPSNRERYTFLTLKNMIADYEASICEDIYIKCFLTKKDKASLMDFKNYEINYDNNNNNNPYTNEFENMDPLNVDASKIIEYIVGGHPMRMKGYVIQNVKHPPFKNINKEYNVVFASIKTIDVFKRDASLEGLSNQELIDAFAKKQEEFHSKQK